MGPSPRTRRPRVCGQVDGGLNALTVARDRGDHWLQIAI